MIHSRSLTDTDKSDDNDDDERGWALDLLQSLKILDGLMTQRPLLWPMQRWSHDGVGAMFYRAISAPASITCAIRAAGLGTGVRRWRSSGLGGPQPV